MNNTIRQRLIKLLALNKLKEYRFTDDNISKIYYLSDRKEVMLKLVMLRVCGFQETFDIVTESETFLKKKG